MPPVRNQQPFKGYLKALLRASQSNRNNIPYTLYIYIIPIEYSYLYTLLVAYFFYLSILAV